MTACLVAQCEVENAYANSADLKIIKKVALGSSFSLRRGNM
jgi:hypothetical protein